MAGARAIDDRRRAPRLVLLATIGAAHLAAIWLLLSSADRRRPVQTSPVMAMFDVAPPIVPSHPPPSPPPPRPPKAPRTVPRAGGGSPGHDRERAAMRVDAPASPVREAMDATPSPLPLGPPPALAAGTAPFDLGNGGANGRGAGNGSEPGNGDGSGAVGGTDEFGRAEWVKRPPNDSFRRHWPLGRSRLAQQVVVVLACSVRRSGIPYRCRLQSESPLGLGFARTALMVVPEARVRPVSRNGSPLWDTPVLVTVIFDAIEVAPLVPVSGAASAPRAR